MTVYPDDATWQRLRGTCPHLPAATQAHRSELTLTLTLALTPTLTLALTPTLTLTRSTRDPAL